jgi:hypothetical protein
MPVVPEFAILYRSVIGTPSNDFSYYHKNSVLSSFILKNLDLNFSGVLRKLSVVSVATGRSGRLVGPVAWTWSRMMVFVVPIRSIDNAGLIINSRRTRIVDDGIHNSVFINNNRLRNSISYFKISCLICNPSSST